MRGLALITGANGFVGRHLTIHLLQQGYQVRALDKTFQNHAKDGAQRIEGDILDTAILQASMEGVDTVFHLAAITSLWMPDDSCYQTVNVEGTRNVLNEAINANVRRFVYCSSFVTTIAGPRNSRTIDETEVPETKALFGAYARSKRRAERIVLEASNRIETTVVMPSAPLGPGDYNLTAPTRFIRDLVNGRIPATIDQIINFIDVQLLAEAIAVSAESAPSGERYLFTGQNLDMRDFLKKMEMVTGLPMPKQRVPYELAALASIIEEKILCRLIKRPPKAPYAGVRMAGRKRDFDNTKATAELDINLRPIDDALIGSLLWLKKEGHLQREMPSFNVVQE